MVKDAFYFLTPLLAVVLALASFGWYWVASPFVVLSLFVAWFFRNPERIVPPEANTVVSPADGKVIQLVETEEGRRLTIFLSVFDVHVNRSPIAGRVESLEYRPGKFLVAYDDRASVENEQLRITFASDQHRLSIALIAGLVARRIIPWIHQGDLLNKGDRIGLIRFGSRADILLPPDCQPVVAKGDRVRGGSSVIAIWKPK